MATARPAKRAEAATVKRILIREFVDLDLKKLDKKRWLRRVV